MNKWSEMDSNLQSLSKWKYNGTDWNGSISGPMNIYHEVVGSPVETEIPVLQDHSEGNFYKKIRSFLNAVKDNGSAPVPTSQILYNQIIIDNIVKSAKSGQEIVIDIPEI